MNIKYLLLFCLTAFAMNAQSLDPSVDRDSLFKTLITRVNPKMQEEFTREYKSMPPGEGQDQLLYAMSQPQGSKKTMVANLEKKQTYFNQLIHLYSAMVPQEHSVLVVYHPEDKLFGITESYDIAIYGPLEGTDMEGHNMPPGDALLQKALDRLQWAQQDLEKLKTALLKAGCTGIQNGFAAVEVTFAANFMERYSYIVFNKDVSATAVKEYVTDCTAVQYNNSIVLQYRGMAGTECFPE